MPRSSYLFGKAFWILLLKVLALGFVGAMILVQIPELGYDFSPREPVPIEGPEDLAGESFKGSTFVSLAGTPNFEKAFIYQRYGLSYTYFNVDPYGVRMVVRTYDEVDEEWRRMSRLLGRLKPFESQPFSYAIRDIYAERFQVEIGEGTFFLSLDDVPKPNSWQIGAISFASVLWFAMIYMFFFFKRTPIHDTMKGKAGPSEEKEPARRSS
jgi:hypothetical protein